MKDVSRYLALSLAIGASLLVIGCEGRDAVPEINAAAEELALPVEVTTSELINPNFIFEFEYLVPVDEDVELHLVEKFSVKSVFSRHRKAMLMLPPTLATNEFYDADVEGDDSYNALERMAQKGYFAFAVSYEGYGESSFPEDGRTVTFERCLDQVGFLVEVIRVARLVRKVDIFGASMGSSLAMALGGVESPIPHRHIGKIIVTSMPYKSFSPFVLENVFTPEFEAYMSSLPFIETGPEMYAPVAALASPEAVEWIFSTLPGVYATGPTLEAFDLPMYLAELGRAPALQIYGDADIIHTMEDVMQFQNDYGGHAELMVVEGGGHSPTFEPSREAVWERIMTFLEI